MLVIYLFIALISTLIYFLMFKSYKNFLFEIFNFLNIFISFWINLVYKKSTKRLSKV